MLSVDERSLFESNAIAEYLDETISPRLHPEDPVKRARNRAWTDFVPDFSRQLGTVTYAKDTEALADAMLKVPRVLARIEEAIEKERGNSGPYFNGPDLCLVDAAYAPFLIRFSIAEKYIQSGLLHEFPNLQNWLDALLENDSVKNSVAPEFLETFNEALHRRGSYAAQLMQA